MRERAAQITAQGNDYRPMAEINITPMVDVMLVMLIIFMVITPMLQRGKPVTLPDAKHVSTLGKGGDPILLSVYARTFKWITDEMSISMERTTRSPILCEAKDYVTGLYDADGNMLEQTENLPILAFSLAPVCKYIKQYFGDDQALGLKRIVVPVRSASAASGDGNQAKRAFVPPMSPSRRG